jgi:Toastrack DUF4097
VRNLRILVVALMLSAGNAVPALAQRFPFERSYDVTGPAMLDVSTVRGKIDVVAGQPGRIVVNGTATVRIDWNVPANAVELAKKVAANPPIERDGQTLKLRSPADAAEQRALTISYQLQVPANTQVLTTSESGATTVGGVSGSVSVRTQSGAIQLERLGGTVDVTTGSGAVTVDDVSGALTAKTGSSAFTGRSLKSGVRVRTQSGAVIAELAGSGDVDVETGSSAIRVSSVRGALRALTESGHITASGAPHGPWTATAGSGSLDITIDSGVHFNVDALSRSGSATVEGASVKGTVTKRQVTGAIGSGGPLVRATSRSGSVKVRVGSEIK